MPARKVFLVQAINDPTRDLHERLILEWKCRDEIELGQPRYAMWTLLENSDNAMLEKLERAFPQEVMAVRLFNTTWVTTKLVGEGLLRLGQ